MSKHKSTEEEGRPFDYSGTRFTVEDLHSWARGYWPDQWAGLAYDHPEAIRLLAAQAEAYMLALQAYQAAHKQTEAMLRMLYEEP